MTELEIENEAWAALDRIYDPCSIATRSALTIVEMGLVRAVEVDEERNVSVRISPTAPSCTLITSIAAAAEKELGAIHGVGTVDVLLDSDFFWSPEAMSDRGKAELARHRAARSALAPKPLGRLARR